MDIKSNQLISKKLNNLFDVNIINGCIICSFKLGCTPNIDEDQNKKRTLTIDLISLEALKKKIRKKDNISLEGIKDIEYCIDWNTLFAKEFRVDEMVIKGDATVNLEGNFESLKRLTVAAKNINVNSSISTRSGFYLGASEALNLHRFSKIRNKKGYSFINGNIINIDEANIAIEDGRLVVNCGYLNLNGSIVADNIKIDSFELSINESSILSNNLFLRSNTLTINNSKIDSDVIDISSPKINSKDNFINASSEITFINEGNDIIDGIISPRIIYNSEDISELESIKRKKKIQALVSLLNDLNASIKALQERELNEFIKHQKNQPIEKILK